MKNTFIILLTSLLFSCSSNYENNSNLATVEENIKPIKLNLKGKITTLVDGTDVGRVNLWDAVDESRLENGFLGNGDEVIILEENGAYYLVQSLDANKRTGYCMKEFVETE